MLLLDHIHQRMHNNLADDTQLPNGQRFDLLTLALLGASSASDISALHQLTAKLAELKFDTIDYTCLKFLLLLNPGKFWPPASQLLKWRLSALLSSVLQLQLHRANDKLSPNAKLNQTTGAGGLNNYDLVSEAFNQIQRTLLEFCLSFHSQVPDKFNRIMGILPDLRAIAVRGEDFLYRKHLAGLGLPKTLLMEMLHAKRRV